MTDRGGQADDAIRVVAQGLFVLEIVLLVVLWLLPMPDPTAVPGRSPRVVVGS